MNAIVRPISWSFSKMQDFESCPQKYKLKHIDRIPEPDRPLPKGKLEHANDRGTRLHLEAEMFVNGTGPFTPDLKRYEEELNKLKRLYAVGRVEQEGEWAVDQDWEIAEWKTGWLRLKLDALVHASKYEAVVVDFKSGRYEGNQAKHGEQVNLYALVTFLRFPELEEIDVELWYLDHEVITTRHLTRDQSLRFKQGFDRRGKAITTATAFPARANKWSCQWCPYKPSGTGDCPVGV